MTRTITLPVMFDLTGELVARALAIHVPILLADSGWRDITRHDAQNALHCELHQGGTHRLEGFASYIDDEAVAAHVQWAVAQVRRLWPGLDDIALGLFEARYTQPGDADSRCGASTKTRDRGRVWCELGNDHTGRHRSLECSPWTD